MAPPKILQTESLLVVREEILYTLLAVQRSEQAKRHKKELEDLLKLWHTTFNQQLELWDAQLGANLSISGADDSIDVHVDELSLALQTATGVAKNNPHYDLYFSLRPSELKRPVLGEELETIRTWPALLKKESDPSLKAFEKVFKDLIEQADKAIQEQETADTNNEHFRTIGGLKTFIDEVNTVRNRVFSQLELVRTENPELQLPSDWSRSFFRRKRSHLSDADLATRKELRAQARKEAEELAQKRRDALDKLQSAKQELKALKTPAKKKR